MTLCKALLVSIIPFRSDLNAPINIVLGEHDRTIAHGPEIIIPASKQIVVYD